MNRFAKMKKERIYTLFETLSNDMISGTIPTSLSKFSFMINAFSAFVFPSANSLSFHMTICFSILFDFK